MAEAVKTKDKEKLDPEVEKRNKALAEARAERAKNRLPPEEWAKRLSELQDARAATVRGEEKRVRETLEAQEAEAEVDPNPLASQAIIDQTRVVYELIKKHDEIDAQLEFEEARLAAMIEQTEAANPPPVASKSSPPAKNETHKTETHTAR